ncbi:MAG TPA: hypothetical protein VJ111_00390 [Chitinophagaceae bacterium]|nr:hypothetical protein [Chitinophagaceae bacterium]
MALALRIDLYTSDNLHAEFIVEPQWWRPTELLATYSFAARSKNGYMDYSLLITKQQLKEMHRHQLQYIDQEHLQEMNNIVIRQLEDIINSTTEFRKIQINIYEWETSE